MKNFQTPIRSSRRGVTFNGKMFHTVEEASEIIKETNEILDSIK